MEGVYIVKEQLIILEEHELDYLVEDLLTSATYMIDKSYFNSRYERLEGAQRRHE